MKIFNKIFHKDGNRQLSQTVIIAMIFGFSAGVVGQIVSDVYINPWEIDNPVNTNQNLVPELKTVKQFIGTQQDLEVSKSARKISSAVAGIYYQKAAAGSVISQIYLPGDLLANSVVITADGWLLSYGPALTAAKKEALAVNVGGKIYSVSDLISDPTTGAIFIKLSDANNLPVASLGNSAEIVAGQISIAVNILGETAVTSNLNPNYFLMDSANSLIQTSERYNKQQLLSISLRSSFLGSPVVNLNGEVVGLVKDIGDAKKLATAVPVNQLRPVMSDIFRLKKIKRPYLGVTYLDLSNAVGLDSKETGDKNRGALVYQNPKAKSPAALAGLQAGDIIVSVDSRLLGQTDSLADMILGYRVGDKLTLEIYRDGMIMAVEATLAETP